VLSSTWRLRNDLKQKFFEAFAKALEKDNENNGIDNNNKSQNQSQSQTQNNDGSTNNNNNKKSNVNVYEYIIGQTPDFKHLRPRAFEIMAFVDTFKTLPNYHLQDWIAVDDCNLYAPCKSSKIKQHIKDHFVQCNTKIGITEKIADTIIAKLSDQSHACRIYHQNL